MSRHSIKHPKLKRMLVYGFDRPLSYYFYQEFNLKGKHLTPVQWDGCCRHELKEKLMSYGMMMDHPHCVQVIMDIPVDNETWEYLEEEDEWVVKGYIE